MKNEGLNKRLLLFEEQEKKKRLVDWGLGTKGKSDKMREER